MIEEKTVSEDPTPPQSAFDEPGTGNSRLKKLALKGAFWSFLGFGVVYVLRFFSWPIMTRLLGGDEEAKILLGAMAVVDTFMLGLIFLSDVGINLSVIRNERGSEASFQNTAWTIQMMRGVILFALTLLLARPAAELLGQNFTPEQVDLVTTALMVSGFSSILLGLQSTKWAIAQRDLNTRAIVGIEVGSYLFSFLVRVCWVIISPTIWALVAGGLAENVLKAGLSWMLPNGVRNKFAWDKEAAKEIWVFGRWIMLSSALTYAARESGLLVMTARTDLNFISEFKLSWLYASLVVTAIMQMGYKVMYPTFSDLLKQGKHDSFMKALTRARLAVIALTWVAAIGVMLVGPFVAGYLFDDNWYRFEWIMPIMGAGVMFVIIGSSYDHAIIAKEETMINALLQGVYFVVLVAAILVGFRINGQIGAVTGFAAVSLIHYPFKAYWLKKIGIWQPRIDLPLLVVAAAIIAPTLWLAFRIY